jgi:hypothetical protein
MGRRLPRLTADRCSNSTKPSRSRSIAGRRKRWIITGKSCPKAETKKHEGGDEKAQQCGWLKDKYGASWQIVPGILIMLLNDPDAAKSQRVMGAMLRMKKIDIDELKRAYAG